MNRMQLVVLADVARLPDGRMQAVRLRDERRTILDALFWLDRETGELQELRTYRVGTVAEQRA